MEEALAVVLDKTSRKGLILRISHVDTGRTKEGITWQQGGSRERRWD